MVGSVASGTNDTIKSIAIRLVSIMDPLLIKRINQRVRITTKFLHSENYY